MGQQVFRALETMCWECQQQRRDLNEEIANFNETDLIFQKYAQQKTESLVSMRDYFKLRLKVKNAPNLCVAQGDTVACCALYAKPQERHSDIERNATLGYPL